MDIEIEQIKELMRALSESNFSKLVLKRGDTELQLERERAPLASPLVMHGASVEEAAFQSEVPMKGTRGGSGRPELPGTYVTSPMVGTFYSSPAPDRPSFVKVGDLVDAGTVICIIEAMKVMNEVKAGVSGKIVEVLASNGQPVEFGARLFRIQT